MKDKMQQELLKRVDLLAEKIGATGADLFQSYIGHVQIEPWIYIGGSFIALIIAVIFWTICYYGYTITEKKEKETGKILYKGHEIYIYMQIVGLLFGIIATIFVIVLSCLFVQKIPNLYYPEKAAFKQFVEDIGRIK